MRATIGVALMSWRGEGFVIICSRRQKWLFDNHFFRYEIVTIQELYRLVKLHYSISIGNTLPKGLF
jgi:hypothetical protein